ncbi:MAG: glutathione S-transferase family protein [Alphaproteobacteria bacterium]|nr:glutathione S-transferase family protein [Alphaproteobacteria bacterium]
MSEIILHHYPESPISEKARLMLGLKKLPWRSVVMPMIMPKPDLVPLTGGYRKAPVMQIGADIYCDSQRIARELERRYPEPTLFPNSSEGLGYGLLFWSDRPLFLAAVGVAFAAIGDRLPEAFLEDRANFSGRPVDIERWKKAAPMNLDQLRAHVGFLDRQLADDRAFVHGDEPGLADFGPYLSLWFVARGARKAMTSLNESFPHIAPWMKRVREISHGEEEPMEPGEALDVAKVGQSETQEDADANDPRGLKPGDKVTVTPDDTGRDPVAGELLASNPHEIAIRRVDVRVGEVVVHFPRAGFVVLSA